MKGTNGSFSRAIQRCASVTNILNKVSRQRFSEMRAPTTLLAAVLTAYFLVMSSTSASAAVPRVPHFSDLTIVDLNGVDWTNKTLVAGGEYVVRFTVVVEVAQPETELVIGTTLIKTKSVYWNLENQYPGIDTSTWRPGLNTFIFTALEGRANLTLEGRVPDDVTLVPVDEQLTLHREIDLTILTVSLAETGEVLDSKRSTITDGELMAFETEFQGKTSALSNAIVDRRYREFYRDMLSTASRLRAFGDLEKATQLLDSLPGPSQFIPPAETGLTFVFTTIGLGAAAVILAVLWNRGRSFVHYTYRQVGDKSKELDLILIKLNRMDKSIADEVTKVKDDLDQLSRGE